MAARRPSIPVSVAELERRAAEAMDERAANYVFAGAGSEDTMDANREAFQRRRIVPRMLRDVAERDLSTDSARYGDAGAADAGADRRAEGRPRGRRACHGAGRRGLGLPMIASTASAFTLEEIAEAGGEAPRWFQLYWPNDRELAESFVGRAEAAGYGAIVLTVDTFVPGWKPRDLQQAWLPFLKGTGIANYFQDPVFRAGLEQTPEEDVGAATGHFLGVHANPALTWDDLAWLREQTSLPIARQGHPARRRRPRGGSSAGSTASSSPTTAAAKSTARSAPSTPCRRSPRRSATS